MRQQPERAPHGRFDVSTGHRMAGRRDEASALAHDFDFSAAGLQGAQQRLFHDVSHELRSPLSRLQAVGGTQIGSRGFDPNDQARH